jgi:protein gp37
MTKTETGKYWNKAWQLVDGCTKVSPACQNCWAEGMAKRFFVKSINPLSKEMQYHRKKSTALPFNWNGRIVLRHSNLDLPLWTRKPTVFSIWNDLFHEKVPFEFILQAMIKMKLRPQHTFLMLTKRIGRVLELSKIATNKGRKLPLFLNNLWLGTTCENQKCVDERIPTLLQIPVAHRFVSLEPLLGAVNLDSLTEHCSCVDSLHGNRNESDSDGNITTSKYKALDWVIVGAETGPKARSCPIENIKNIIEQCRVAGIPVWVKAIHIGIEKKFKQIRRFDNLPESVRIRQLPF